MNPELDKKLVEDFPTLYWQRGMSMMETAMCWGFECQNGWEPLIRELSEKLVPLVEQFNKDYPPKPEEMYNGFAVVQVKEKFGGLRYYTNYSSKEINDLIDEYETLSYKTCEICGKPGKTMGQGWYYTACPEHTKEQDREDTVLRDEPSLKEQDKDEL